MVTNKHVLSWIEEMAALTCPDKIVWIDGTEEQAEAQFGFLMNAFKFGAPPHGGIAFGLDRLVALSIGLEDIRDVIAFPKVQNASELMTKCPTPADPKALEELCVAVVAEEE